MIAYATPTPAMLKVFDGAISVMVRREVSGARLAIGRCPLPGSNSRSQWISSETSRRSCFSANAASRDSSSRVKIVPPGLYGLHSMSMRVPARTETSRAASSKTHRPPASFMGTLVEGRGALCAARKRW